MSKRKFVFYTKWDKHNMLCACMFHNPLCDKFKDCEEIELTLNPYDDVESVMRDQRTYKREKGVIKQK